MARSPAPIFDRMIFPDYEFHEFPKWLYGLDGKGKIVESEEEEDALEGDWFATPQEAAKAKAAAAAKAMPPAVKAP